MVFSRIRTRSVPVLLVSLGLAIAAPQNSKSQAKPDPWSPKVEELPGSAPPSALLGEWTRSDVSTINFVNPNTGSYSDPSGERTAYPFYPDGTYKLGWLKQSALYGCTSSIFGYTTGVYQVQGSTLIMQAQSTTLTSRDNCHPQWNYDKTLPNKRFVTQWRLGRTKYGLVLIFHDTDGKENVFAKEQGKGLLGL